MLIQKDKKKNLQFIDKTNNIVEKGALATESIDYEKLGYQTGERVIDILNGKNPKDIPVETLKQTTLVVNQKIAKKYNISLDNPKLKNAVKK